MPLCYDRRSRSGGEASGRGTTKGTRITGELILEELGDGRARSRRSVFAADDLRNENIAFGSPEAARRSPGHLPRCRRCLSL
jgi:hypothetical protein